MRSKAQITCETVNKRERERNRRHTQVAHQEEAAAAAAIVYSIRFRPRRSGDGGESGLN